MRSRRAFVLDGRVGLAGTAAMCMAGALSGGAVNRAADTPPDYMPYTQSYRVPFAGTVNFQHLTGLHVRASLNGGPPMAFLVDTGSVGIVVAADQVPNIDPNAPPGVIRYSSSGVEFDGVWTKTTVTFPDSRDAQGHVATAVVPVLAVKERKVSGVGVNSAGLKPELNPRVYMFGVGFGRGKEAHPERNPFINLAEMQAGIMRRGYTITRDGFTLGLTGRNVGTGYVYQKLVEKPVSPETTAMRPGLKDWLGMPGSLSVDTLHAPMGSILMDTGLTNMMLAAPDAPTGTDVPAGALVTIHLLGDRLHYRFKVGDTADPVTPRRVTWVKPTGGVFVNTGLRALAAFDTLFDADGGYMALRPVEERTAP